MNLYRYLEYASGSTKLQNVDSVWIRVRYNGFESSLMNCCGVRFRGQLLLAVGEPGQLGRRGGGQRDIPGQRHQDTQEECGNLTRWLVYFYPQYVTSSVVDPDPEIWPNLDPGERLILKRKKNIRILIKFCRINFIKNYTKKWHRRKKFFVGTFYEWLIFHY